MADQQSLERTLKIECMFVDGDTRNITLKNPISNPTTSDFTSLEQFMQEKNIIIGDRYGGRFGKIKKATIVTKTDTSLDLTD